MINKVAEELAIHVQQSNCFNYSTKLQGSPVERDKILPWSKALRILIEADARDKDTLEKIFLEMHAIKMKELASGVISAWPLTRKDDDFFEKWATTSALRVRTMCRHISVSAANGKSWAKERHMCCRCNARFCYNGVVLSYLSKSALLDLRSDIGVLEVFRLSASCAIYL